MAAGDNDVFLRAGAAAPKDVIVRPPTVFASTSRNAVGQPAPRGNVALAVNSAADAMRRIGLPVDNTSWTGCIWVRYDSSTGDDSLIFGTDAAGTGLFLEWKTGVLKLVDTHGFSRPASLGGTAVNGKWYFVALKVAGTTATIYLGDETTACINTTGTIVAQGGSQSLWLSFSSNPVTGALFGAECFNAQLTDAEVEARRLATSPASAPGSLSGFWALAGPVSKLIDTSGNGNDLIANSTGPWEETAGPLQSLRSEDTVTLDDATLAASATFTNGITATLAVTLDAAQLAGTASTNTASLGKTLGDATLSAAAAHGVAASLGVTLGNAALSASASTVTSSLARTLGDAALSAAASTVTASLSKTLAAATLAASAAHGVAASLSSTLGNATLSSSASTVTASLAKTLGNATLSASAAHGVAASVSRTLADSTLSAAGSTTVASLGKTLGNATLVSAAQFGSGVSASLSKTLADATLTASSSTAVASMANTLGNATLSAAAARGVGASFAGMLGDSTLVASASFTPSTTPLPFSFGGASSATSATPSGPSSMGETSSPSSPSGTAGASTSVSAGGGSSKVSP